MLQCSLTRDEARGLTISRQAEMLTECHRLELGSRTTLKDSTPDRTFGVPLLRRTRKKQLELLIPKRKTEEGNVGNSCLHVRLLEELKNI